MNRISKNSNINYKHMKKHTCLPNNQTSAQEIVKVLMKYVNPSSVLDIGCGIGIWLNEFQKSGTSIQGIDGKWVLDFELEINKDHIEIYDFEDQIKRPRCIWGKNARTFDLAICLEMAEHITSERSDFLVDTLTKASNVIYFSGATPNSGGMHHVNERWQTYWIHKFRERDYEVIDLIRPLIWDNPWVAYFYAEESFLFIKKDKLAEYPMIKEYIQQPIYDIVHPIHFMEQLVKPTHDWKYLLELQKRLIYSYIEKFMFDYRHKQ